MRRGDGALVLKYKDGKTWRSHRVPADVAASERSATKYAGAFIGEVATRNAHTLVLGVRNAGSNDGAKLADHVEPWLKLRKDPKLSPAIRAQNESNFRIHVLHRDVAD